MIDSVSDAAGAAADLKKARRLKSISTESITLDRLPPHSLECEMGVLGCVLLSPNESMGVCIEKLKDDGMEAFYDLRHQTIYETLATMYDANDAIDIITVQQRLKDKQLLDQVGGIAYLSQLQDSVPSAANLSYYIEHVREKFLLRKMIRTCTEVVGRVYDYEGEVDDFLDAAERDIMRVGNLRLQHDSFVDIAGTQQRVIQQYEDAFTGKKHFGIPTGFADIDHIIGGLKPQEMIGLGGTPSMGKTSLMLCMLNHIAIESGVPCGLFSLDDPADTVIHRIACIRARVNGAEIMRGNVTEEDLTKLSSAMGKINAAKQNLIIDDYGGLNERTMLAKGRRMIMAGAKVIFIDYLQLVGAQGKGMYERTTNASHAIKNMAKELNVPVVCISAITRPHDAKPSWKPTLFDFRGSGDIDYDLNQAWLIYKNPADTSDEFAHVQQVCLDVAKNKQGGTGRVDLMFYKTFTRFEAAEKINDHDIPKPQ